ncbi:MAG: YeeE/YedE family protein [Gammaproteobacteria bacterium]|nr:YeeE/YedE family protein [Gammaproteobacteria bacterium]
MMEWEPVYRVALLGLLVGILFGAVTNKTNFCTMGAISDWVNTGSKDRLRAWLLAIGIAIVVTQTMDARGVIDIREAAQLTANFGWLGHILGGILFGIGMTLSSGCGQRILVRVGGGNLKSLVVLMFVGLTAYMTMRGILSLVRVNAIEVTNINLAESGLSNQGMGTLLGAAFGVENLALLNRMIAAVLGGGLIVYAFAAKTFRGSFNNILAGIITGLIIPAGWYITGVVGFDDFDPVRLQSYTIIAPTAESFMYLMTYTGSTISFGVAAIFGIIGGSFLYVILTGRFRLETFTDRSDMIRHMQGGILMGFGGVVALGCTVGQGLTGMSTLALGSLLTLISIVFGCALAMKIEYYRLDEISFLRALRQSLVDMRLFPGTRQTD